MEALRCVRGLWIESSRSSVLRLRSHVVRLKPHVVRLESPRVSARLCFPLSLVSCAPLPGPRLCLALALDEIEMGEGVVASLSARCSVLAAANPIGGHYNRGKTIAENLKVGIVGPPFFVQDVVGRWELPRKPFVCLLLLLVVVVVALMGLLLEGLAVGSFPIAAAWRDVFLD